VMENPSLLLYEIMRTVYSSKMKYHQDSAALCQ